MIFKRLSLAFSLIAAGLTAVAAPALANETNTAAAVGMIDLTKVAPSAGEVKDGNFEQLFAKWDQPAARPVSKISVAVPSRMPLDHTVLTSDYGMRTHPVIGGRRAHKGVDLSAPTGTPIYATADGVVSKAEPFSSYGNFVSIEHGADVQTRYAHMSRITAFEGQRVKKGDLIGYVGSTGRSTGPHLHYEVRVAGEAVNPVPYMADSQAQRAFALAMAHSSDDHAD